MSDLLGSFLGCTWMRTKCALKDLCVCGVLEPREQPRVTSGWDVTLCSNVVGQLTGRWT
jgi:hypothetical protein